MSFIPGLDRYKLATPDNESEFDILEMDCDECSEIFHIDERDFKLYVVDGREFVPRLGREMSFRHVTCPTCKAKQHESHH